jgi:hypothetical protein
MAYELLYCEIKVIKISVTLEIKYTKLMVYCIQYIIVLVYC